MGKEETEKEKPAGEGTGEETETKIRHGYNTNDWVGRKFRCARNFGSSVLGIDNMSLDKKQHNEL
jgi:hypothetical protein